MLVLPPQFPKRVPDHGAEAPAAVMSRKSTSVLVVQVPTVSVLAVPARLPELSTALRNTRPVGPLPEQISVVMV